MRWFRDIDAELHDIANSDGDPEAHLHHFLLRLYQLKRERYDADPELFKSYLELAKDNMDAVDVHLQRMHQMLPDILATLGDIPPPPAYDGDIVRSDMLPPILGEVIENKKKTPIYCTPARNGTTPIVPIATSSGSTSGD